MYDPLGLSIGTTNLVAARHSATPVIRPALLGLVSHGSPRIGSAADGPGITIGGFVEKIGSSQPLIGSDGSRHDPDLLMVEALDAMVTAAGADASSAHISIAVPAYWTPATVTSLRNALRTHIGFVRSGLAPQLISDAIAAATAVKTEIGLPDTGVVAVLDFGAKGTSVTLVGTKGDLELASATMRYVDFSGDEIDKALLMHVLDELGHRGRVDTEGAEFAALREECRAAKERLSTSEATTLAVTLSGYSAEVQLTRLKLESLFQDHLIAFAHSFDSMIARSRFGWAELSALVTVGGGAAIPLVAERLGLHTRRPVLTVDSSEMAAAVGALELAGRDERTGQRSRISLGLLAGSAAGTTVIELPSGGLMLIDPDARTERKLAWSQSEFTGELPVRIGGDAFDEDGPAGWSMRLNIIDEPPKVRPRRRLRIRPSQVLIGLSAVVAIVAIGGVAFTLATIENRHDPLPPGVVPSTPQIVGPSQAVPEPESAEPVAPAPPAEPEPNGGPAPSAAVVAPPPAPPKSQPRHWASTAPTTAAPPATTAVPPSTTAAAPTMSDTPTPTAETPTTTTTPPVQLTTQWIHVPLLPIPIPIVVPKNVAPPNPGGGSSAQNSFQDTR